MAVALALAPDPDTPPVCVVTRWDDLTADRLVRALEERGAPVLRFDLADAPHRLTLHAELGRIGWAGTLTVHGRSVALEEIGGIYWGHAQPAETLRPVRAGGPVDRP